MLAVVAAFLIGGIFLFAENLPKAVAIGGEPTAQSLTLEDFESYGAGAFPEKWRMAKSDARKIYKGETEGGNRFLRARSEK